MKARYEDIDEWVRECKALIQQDLDNVILFTGDEGVGKSTLAFQIMHALDPAFTVERCHFTIRDFLDVVGEVPPGGSILLDEAELNSRRGMYTDTLDFLDHLQVGRGLNQHVGICFPHEALFEKAIARFRIRWKIHVPQRGFFNLYKRTKREWRNRRGELETSAVWTLLGSWKFTRNRGQAWQHYLAKKHATMRARHANKKADPDDAAKSIDHDGLRDYAETLRNEYGNRTPPPADLHSPAP